MFDLIFVFSVFSDASLTFGFCVGAQVVMEVDKKKNKG